MTAQFINQLLTPLIFAVFATGFAVIWFHNRKLKSAAWWALSYISGACAFLFEASFNGPSDLVFIRYMGDNFYLLTTLFFAMGVVVRYCQPIPVKTLLGIGGGVSLLNGWFWFVDPDIAMRTQIISFGCSALLAVSLPIMRRAQFQKIDHLLFWLIAISSVQISLNTVVVLHFYGESLTIANFSSSMFLAILNFSIAAISLALAIVLFVGFGMDLFSKLRKQSDTDPLSGLFNRRAFEVFAQLEIEKAGQMRTPLSLVVCDIDHFKSVNDEFGHSAGDQVINVFADLLKSLSRTSDISGRVGGEEFCLLLPTATAQMATLVAETIRTGFSADCMDQVDQRLKVTASFGVAEICAGEGYKELFKRADEALYKAKRSGRDRVWTDAYEWKKNAIARHN